VAWSRSPQAGGFGRFDQLAATVDDGGAAAVDVIVTQGLLRRCRRGCGGQRRASGAESGVNCRINGAESR
jgi:hypothetical protein